MSLFPVGNDVCAFTLATAATDVYRNGVRLRADGLATRAALLAGNINNAQNGLNFTDDGQVIVIDSTGGLPPGTVYVNGLPITTAGELCVSSDSPVVYNQGMPFTENGSIRGAIG